MSNTKFLFYKKTTKKHLKFLPYIGIIELEKTAKVRAKGV